MSHRFGRTVVIALGGSVVHPDAIDVSYLKRLVPFVRRITKRRRVLLVIGGGRLSRRFQDAAHAVVRHGSPRTRSLADEDKDWLGIHATRLNAHLLRTVFRDIADPVVRDSRRKRARLCYPVTVAAGWRPGWSTDYVAAVLAADLGAQEFVVAGKPSHVYNKDHARHRDAKPVERISWREYRRLVPAKWRPGLHAPVDPVAAAFAARKGLAALVVNGRDLENFSELLNGRVFQGTIIG